MMQQGWTRNAVMASVLIERSAEYATGGQWVRYDTAVSSKFKVETRPRNRAGGRAMPAITGNGAGTHHQTPIASPTLLNFQL